MGWRDFQAEPQREYMEYMESITIATPLIPLIPLIPLGAIPESSVEQPNIFHGAAEVITAQGDRLWIATEQKAVKLVPGGAVYFTGAEIMELMKTGKEAARAAVMAKSVFGNGTVVVENQDYPTGHT